MVFFSKDGYYFGTARMESQYTECAPNVFRHLFYGYAPFINSENKRTTEAAAKYETYINL